MVCGVWCVVQVVECHSFAPEQYSVQRYRVQDRCAGCDALQTAATLARFSSPGQEIQDYPQCLLRLLDEWKVAGILHQVKRGVGYAVAEGLATELGARFRGSVENERWRVDSA